MAFKKIIGQFNIFPRCRKYGLPLWQCPPFLFLVMGVVIIVSSITAYVVGTRYIEDPETIALIVLALAAVLFIVAFIITQSFEKLAEASRMKSEFIHIVSHQMRTPLSNLKWAIELVMSGRLGKIEEKQIEYFTVLKENISRMGELIQDLLMVSRIETDALAIEKRDVSLADLILKLVSEFELFAKASNVEIRFKGDKDLPKVFVDPFQLRQVLENLLDNAVRYIRGGGLVEIFLAEKNKNIYFEIKDNGVGIPKEDQKYIFQKFFRSDNAVKGQTQGSGLGLYIAKYIIEKSGGEIGFKSQEGKGSTFWFTLPIFTK
jgi:signal transduction histidine kinase